MRILVLNRSNLATTPYAQWLGPAHEVVLVTSTGAISTDPERARAELSGYREVVTFERFHANAAVETTALDLHRRHGFDAVIAMNEYDLLRAARLREAMGIDGQGTAEAEAFRDKLRMKEVLTAAGVRTTPFAPVAHVTDLYAFAAEHGYPFVVKPRRGAGSTGVEVLRDADGLAAYAEAHTALGDDDGAALLAEAYVEHELFHIDGLIVAGTTLLVWPSACTSALTYREGTVFTSTTLDAHDPLTEPLRELTLRAVRALSAWPTLTFHAEVFRTADGTLLLNEIASRVGGGKIYETVRLATGVDLVREYIQAVGDAGVHRPPVDRPERTAGFALFPGSPGTLAAAPAEGTCDVAGVDQYRLNVPVGTFLGVAEHSSARIASVVVGGEDRAAAGAVLAEAVDWFRAACEITPPEPDPAP